MRQNKQDSIKVSQPKTISAQSVYKAQTSNAKLKLNLQHYLRDKVNSSC